MERKEEYKSNVSAPNCDKEIQETDFKKLEKAVESLQNELKILEVSIVDTSDTIDSKNAIERTKRDEPVLSEVENRIQRLSQQIESCAVCVQYCWETNRKIKNLF